MQECSILSLESTNLAAHFVLGSRRYHLLRHPMLLSTKEKVVFAVAQVLIVLVALVVIRYESFDDQNMT
jgi:hypothetical protein